MSWVELVAGAGVAALAYQSGVTIGFGRGRSKEREKSAKPPKLLCTCEHGLGTHDDCGPCHGQVKRPNKWGKMTGYSGSDHEIGWEYVPCPCTRYDGPEAPMSVLNWRPPPALPPSEQP